MTSAYNLLTKPLLLLDYVTRPVNIGLEERRSKIDAIRSRKSAFKHYQEVSYNTTTTLGPHFIYNLFLSH